MQLEVALAVGLIGQASKLLGIATVLDPVASCAKEYSNTWPVVQLAKVDDVIFAVKAVLSTKPVTVPALDDPHVNVGVAEKDVVTLAAALPVPPKIMP